MKTTLSNTRMYAMIGILITVLKALWEDSLDRANAIYTDYKMKNAMGNRTLNVSIQNFIEMVIGLTVGVIMIPVVEEIIRTTNTTAWDFTGSTGAITIFRFIPFLFIAFVLVWFAGKAFGKW